MSSGRKWKKEGKDKKGREEETRGRKKYNERVMNKRKSFHWQLFSEN